MSPSGKKKQRGGFEARGSGEGGEGEGVKEAAGVRKVRRGGKAGLEMKMNLARGFTLERLLAVLRAVHPGGVGGMMRRSVADRVAGVVADLERLRLLVSSEGGGRGLDDGGAGGGGEERKWRVNVPRGFVEDLGGRFEGVMEGVGGLVREFELVEG